MLMVINIGIVMEKHRENDLPAIINGNGSKFWYYDGKEHRENYLPTVIWFSGLKK